MLASSLIDHPVQKNLRTRMNMENKFTKEDLISSPEKSRHGKKNQAWIKHMIETVGVLLRKRGFQEMSVYQAVVLVLGMITLLVLEYIYGIRLFIILGVVGITLSAFLALMYLGKK